LFFRPGDPPITIKVQQVSRVSGQVRLCIDAPKSVNVVRDELLAQMADKTKREGMDADDQD
jgi:sRNA-binding carbon storage regulator CsrA